MDLDSFEKEFRKFRDRVEPMLKEWEEHKAKSPESEAAKALDAEIHAPLVPEDGAAPAAKTGLKGPTLAQWLGAGYKASAYPPAPYESQNTPEEIAAAVAAEKAAATT
ncbi:hypothetical protein [Bradyrhizobium sp.]